MIFEWNMINCVDIIVLKEIIFVYF